MSSRLKIGIIGCRMISASHIRGYLYLPEKVEIVALCDVVQDSAERRLNNVVEEAKNRADQWEIDDQEPPPLS